MTKQIKQIKQQRLKALLESPSRGIRDEIEISRLEKELEANHHA